MPYSSRIRLYIDVLLVRLVLQRVVRPAIRITAQRTVSIQFSVVVCKTTDEQALQFSRERSDLS